MTGRLAGKSTFITGAAQGLGESMARTFAAEGAKVFLTDLQADKVAAVADDINNTFPGAAASMSQDVTDEAQWKSAIGAVVEAFGGLHVLVNNAGIGIAGTVEQTSLEDWRHLHAVDLDSVFLGCKYAMPVMRDSGGGSIVNISSIAGIIAGWNFAAYNSAKAGVCHLSKSVALDGARTARKGGPLVRCNSIHPVFIDTAILDPMVGTSEEGRAKLSRQVPVGRIGDPIDVAYAALYLASDESRFVTGVELRVDGGISAG